MIRLLARLLDNVRGRETRATAPVVAPVVAKAGGRDRTFLLTVAGGGFSNPDGTSRQRIIKRCRAGEPVVLICEPFNPYDYLAVAVWRRAPAERIGYLPRGHGLARLVEQHRVAASIARISGGTGERRARDVVLQVSVAASVPPFTSDTIPK